MRAYFSFFTMASVSLFALPENPSVASGDVNISQETKKMSIHASNRSIINYTSFDIQNGEKVQFIQPSSSSCVLNRVQGGKASKILGQMESNGKVLLVNPNGMYFGPSASVKTSSFIASTLDIADTDFLKSKYFFSLQNKERLREIRNEGFLQASSGGCVVLMAAQVHNLGTIEAPSGNVVLAAGERVTLDFQGDRLLQFSVEGDVKGAVLEHLGSIQAEGGQVSMRLPTAKKSIREIVNHEGMEKGEVFVQQNGEIFLVSGSSIAARNVDIEASFLSVEGKIDVSSTQKKGGTVHLSGPEIALKGAYIDASGKIGGGEVLIGGDVQGSGPIPHALFISMDEHSQILANATTQGDGGRVILWSRQKTEFEGKISAQGGLLQGNGGFVETSGLEALFSRKGYVDTSAFQGTMGEWLLDPITTLHIVPGLTPSNPGCSGGTIGVDSFTGSLSNVNLCSNEIHVQVDTIAMTQLGAGLVFSSPSLEGILHLEGAGGPAMAITTVQGNVIMTNMNILLDKDLAIDTTSLGSFPVGAGIVLQNIDATGIGIGILLNAGNSVINLGDIGRSSSPKNVIAHGSAIFAKNVITQGGGSVNFLGPVFLERTSIFDTSNGGGNITLHSVDSIRPGYSSLVVNAGTGNVLIQGIGANSPMGDVLIVSAADGVVTGDIITQNGIVQIVPSLQLVKSLTVIKTFSDLNNLLSAPITLTNVIASIPNVESLALLTGLKGSITLGNLGSEEVFLKNLIIETNQPLSIQDVYAGSVTVDALSGPILFNGSMNLKEGLTVVDANTILLGGPINADSVTLQSRNSIFNQNGSYPINIPDTGSLYLNAASGQIGTETSPLMLNGNGPISLGGDPIYVTGNHSAVNYIPGHLPCLILFRGQELVCALAHKVVFAGLEKSTFARSFHFNNVYLGIDFPAYWYNNMQFSPFAPINPTSGNLSGNVQRL